MVYATQMATLANHGKDFCKMHVLHTNVGKARMALVSACCLIGLGQAGARAAVTITDTVSGAFLVSGAKISTATHSNVKISFSNNTAGTNLELCAGTTAQFSAKVCGTVVSDSGGPGFNFLTLVDLVEYNDKYLYVLEVSGTEAASFTLTIE